MDAHGLTDPQRHQLVMGLAERRDWFKRLRERMDAVGWDRACPAYLAAVAAQDAMQALLTALWDARPPLATIIGPRKAEAARANPPATVVVPPKS